MWQEIDLYFSAGELDYEPEEEEEPKRKLIKPNARNTSDLDSCSSASPSSSSSSKSSFFSPVKAKKLQSYVVKIEERKQRSYSRSRNLKRHRSRSSSTKREFARERSRSPERGRRYNRNNDKFENIKFNQQHQLHQHYSKWDSPVNGNKLHSYVVKIEERKQRSHSRSRHLKRQRSRSRSIQREFGRGRFHSPEQYRRNNWNNDWRNNRDWRRDEDRKRPHIHSTRREAPRRHAHYRKRDDNKRNFFY